MERINKLELAFGNWESLPKEATYVAYAMSTIRTKPVVNPDTGEVTPAQDVRVLYLKDEQGNGYVTRSEGLTRQFEQILDELDGIPSIHLKVVEKDLGKGRRVKRFIL